MAAGSAAERAEAKGRASARKRGREACLPASHLVSCLAYFVPKSLSYSCIQPHMLTPPTPLHIVVSTLDRAV